MKKLIFAVMAVAGMISCSKSQKILVLYYSQTGITESVAQEIQAQTGADIASFDVLEKYNGTYEETIQRYIDERERGFDPTLEELSCDISKYDVIFLGYPVWFGTYASPVRALINSGLLEGKTIVPFCTFGSGGIESSSASLKTALPSCDIKEGYGVRSARISKAKEELNRFLIENGWKEGAIAPLAEFSEQHEVSAEEAEIFQTACAGYKYPLGTPATASSRTIPGGIEYLFIARGKTPGGQETESRIYITVAENEAAEFTKVVR